jgi:hypothetical protein
MRFSKPWAVCGYALFVLIAPLVARVLYEETVLTHRYGPQMVGYSLMHGSWALPTAVALVVGVVGIPIYLVWSSVLLIRRRFRISMTDWIPLAAVVGLTLLSSVPYVTWEELIVRILGPGERGQDFMIDGIVAGNRRLVGLLLAKGCDINYEDEAGRSPLSAAAVVGETKMLRFLLAKGAAVDRPGNMLGETALMDAAESGNLETTKVLLQAGAKPCLVDKEGHTAEGLARKYHHDNLGDYLASQFHCKEDVIDSCTDPRVSACVHP